MSYISKIDFAELYTKFFKNERYLYHFIQNTKDLNSEKQKDCMIKMIQIINKQQSLLSIAKVKYEDISKSFDIGTNKQNLDNLYSEYHSLVIDIKEYDTRFDKLTNN